MVASLSHPAKFSDPFLPIFAGLVQGCAEVLDPMAGTGKLALIKAHGYQGNIVCNELEPEYATLGSTYLVDEWHFGDAANMSWASSGRFPAVVTSPTYGNRLADHHNARDGSRRFSYKHCLGRELGPENTGQLQWGEPYRVKHLSIYAEIARVLQPAGLFVLNVSNHIRKGVEQDVVGWNRTSVPALGFVLEGEQRVETHRLIKGSNAGLRVGTESILVFRRVGRQ